MFFPNNEIQSVLFITNLIQNPTIVEHLAKVMDVIIQRLSDAYMAIADIDQGDSNLMKIRVLVRKAREVKMAGVA